MHDQYEVATPRPSWSLIKNRWFRWVILLFGVGYLAPVFEGNLVFGLVLIYVILFPTFMYLKAIWKILRFNFFPSPVQFWKGFRRQWHVIEKGPVVVRVHRKKPGST